MKDKLDRTDDGSLFDRVVSILDQARASVVRSVNTNMVTAYWLIGREIVEEVQGGEQRAAYGKQVLETLSRQLNQRYGSGFSVPNLKNFRQFYHVFSERASSIRYPAGSEFSEDKNSCRPVDQFATHQVANSVDAKIPSPAGRELTSLEVSRPVGVKPGECFNPQLSWSHYRALMRVKKTEAREFYEKETADCGWTKTQLERQIQTSYYERIVSNQGAKGLLPANRERLPGERIQPIETLKAPYVLEFLNLPDSANLHESKFEQAIIDNLQAFLLELGKGFAFVARQKRMQFDDDFFYIDLVFYNYILKCFLLIDLKMGELAHQDVGQMDSYVRMFDERHVGADDNPTIGLILCAKKNETIAKYSVLNESEQIFASKYMDYLPTVEELEAEIMREQRLIEQQLDAQEDE